ncbi:MAG: DUF1800 domain-containing protein [Thiogranum sp.]|jgi:hypothetical protein|nr:DUF1800 domain-containing protein [Thiogranum sp.]
MIKPDPRELSTILDRLCRRRDFLKLFGKGLGYSAVASTLTACGGGGGGSDPIQQPPAPVIPQASAGYTVLKRTSFGARRDALATLETLGIDAYLEQQLDYTRIDDGDLEASIQTLFPLTTQSPAQLVGGFPDNIAGVAQQMIAAVQYRQIFSRRQLYEVMVEFWTDHFNIHLLNGLGPTLKPEDDRQVIRTHALGNFRDLLHASAKSPSMLFYLDNFLNQAAAPNENYARELMELHTLGVDGGYSESDVKEVARCFTGWSIRFPGDPGGEYGTFVFVPALHDNNAKVVLQQAVPAGGGQSDGEQVLDFLATHPSTARFIATKLCRRFIRDNPDAASIDAVAAAFTQSSGDIKAALRALFATEAFRSSSDLKLCRPSEYLAGVIRALAPDTPYPTDNGQLFLFAQAIMGQVPYYWPTPDGYPDTQSYWDSTGGLLNRWRLSFLSFANLIPSIDVIQLDYADLLNGADTLAGIVDALTDSILMRPLSDTDRAYLLDWLVSEYGQAADAALPLGTPEAVAPLVTAVLLSSAYFQLR